MRLATKKASVRRTEAEANGSGKKGMSKGLGELNIRIKKRARKESIAD